MFSTSPNRRGMPELFGNQTTIGVGALQFYQYAIATGGADGIVRLWDSRIVSSSKRPMQTFNSTVDGIQATKVYQQFSSSPTSPNGSITNPCIRTLAGHTLPITSLHFTDTHLITGSLDRSVRIWDLRNGKIVEGYLGNSANGIMDVQWDNAKVLIAGGESTITVNLIL